MRRKITVIACISLLGLAGCGDTVLEQTLFGAGAGAVGAAAVGGDTATGAAVGVAGNLFCIYFSDRC
jgi:hypothetical protein